MVRVVHHDHELTMVAGIMKDVAGRSRSLDYITKEKGTPFPVVWVQTYRPVTENIAKVVKKAKTTIKRLFV